jgi:hypothetical protein
MLVNTDQIFIEHVIICFAFPILTTQLVILVYADSLPAELCAGFEFLVIFMMLYRTLGGLSIAVFRRETNSQKFFFFKKCNPCNGC